MLKSSRMHELWVLKDQLLFKKITKKLNTDQEKFDEELKAQALELWHNLTIEYRKQKAEEEQKDRFINILRNSTRGQRSTMEKEEIRRFISSYMSCIPKSINFSEMDTLCNEVDWIPYIGRSILFLQGDFGNCYYMIASGRVGLYLEASKDREMVIAREFGHLRLQPFQGTDDDLQRLGHNIINLPQGAGFGEFAILATSNKIRSCAAVALDPNSMLLVMHADTYNAVLRQHHYRQKQLSSATSLLQELPLFQHQNYSKLASIAYSMRSQTYSNQALIVGYGDAIQKVLIVATGQVKVFAPPTTEINAANAKLVQKRIPKLAIALLGRGQIIGELEVQRGLKTFQMSYEASAAGTEVLEMPLSVFKESVTAGGVTQSMMYRSIEELNDAKEQRRVGRMARAYEAMKSMMVGEAGALRSKAELVRTLPVLIEPPTVGSPNTGLYKKGFSDRPVGPTRLGVGTYYGDERPVVTRKQSFASPRPVETTESGGVGSGGKYGITSKSAFGGGQGALKFSIPERKASVPAEGSPRRAEFTPSGAGSAQAVTTTKSPFAGATPIKKSMATSPKGPKPSAPLAGSPRFEKVAR